MNMDKEKLFTILNLYKSKINRNCFGEKYYSEYVHFKSEINLIHNTWSNAHFNFNENSKLINFLEKHAKNI